MKKFKDYSLDNQAVRVYILSFITSLISYLPFYKLYIFIFKPVMVGSSMYAIYPEWFERIFGITIFTYYFFLPLFVFSLIKRKQGLIWFIGIVVPLSMALVDGPRKFYWSLVLSVFGWLLALCIRLIKDRKNIRKFKELLSANKAISVYFLSILISIILRPIFSFFYTKLYVPDLFRSGYYSYSPELDNFLGGFIISYFLFFSLFVLLLIKRKQQVTWLIGLSVPISLSLNGGYGYILSLLLLFAVCWILAKGILLIKGRK